MHRIFLAAATAVIAMAAPAWATGELQSIITKADQQRLDSYDATRAEALAAAKAGNDVAQFEALSATLAKPQLTFNDMNLTGDWQCRVTKFGGELPFVVYSWFKCRVTDDGSGWMLEKLTGSQKTKGRFYTVSDTRLTYLGAGYVSNDHAPAYGKGASTDQVGYAFHSGANEWRIEFPLPTYESKLDILELRR